MIGIDIIDLKQAFIDSNWKREGYLNKLFTCNEQSLILKHPDPTQMVWLLWSMKEAAYKIYSRERNLRIFAPLKMSCEQVNVIDSGATGRVKFVTEEFYTSTIISNQYILSVSSRKKHQLVEISVKISHKFPIVDYKSTKPQSVSHHGKYLALAYL